MATRSVTMIVDRELASHNEAGFACNPELVDGNSYVNMYLHHDGYPEYRAVELANWVNHMKNNGIVTDSAKMASNLVKDFYYGSQYLYPSHVDIDHMYTYIIWTGKADIWMSCWNQYSSECVFVLKSNDVVRRYESDYDYTNWEKYKQNTKQAG
jgi:hypothetical protein|tara:strand:- start:866 stop:1327 length:462 start_codon:yes stop_codon:yes gene_type:complete